MLAHGNLVWRLLYKNLLQYWYFKIKKKKKKKWVINSSYRQRELADTCSAQLLWEEELPDSSSIRSNFYWPYGPDEFKKQFCGLMIGPVSSSHQQMAWTVVVNTVFWPPAAPVKVWTKDASGLRGETLSKTKRKKCPVDSYFSKDNSLW